MLMDDKGGVKPDKMKSAKVHDAVGSGSRPGKSKMAIMTSAPSNAHTLGRDPGGALK